MSSQDPCANPLLLGWVKEWVDVARERNSKGVTTYNNAYKALKACPIKFQHPSQLQQLKGFGPKICDRLTEKLKQHCEENSLPMPKRPKQSRNDALAGLNDEDDDLQARPAKKPRKAKPYVPTLRSGAYALVLALATLDEDAAVGMTKAQLIEAAQPHCDSSFMAPSDPTKFYTAWNSMKTLLDKDFVYEKGRPLRRYALSDEGWEVAKRIQQTTDAGPSRPAPPQRPELIPQAVEEVLARPAVRSPSVEVESQPQQQSSYANVVADGDGTSASAALPNFGPIRLAPGSFTVHLVLDVREIRAKTDRDYMQQELSKKGVEPIMRSLELGDALWVAKCHDPNFLPRLGSEGDEIVLDWIVERKRLDDLIFSIKDGRFHEQKFRLKRSGVKNVVYIVEEMCMDATHFQKWEEAVDSAMASTQVVNGYFLKKTQKMDDTIRYLTRMTMLLKKQYESKSLFVIPTQVLTAQNYLPLLDHLREKDPVAGHYISYPAFASMASKSDSITLRDLYLKMLMCTKQVTGEKALEMQKRWKTPHDFVKAYENCGAGEDGKKKKRELVFGQMGNLVGRRKIAKTLSHKIAEVWGDV
ncbi:Uu.00g048810.m01.CDS01 [Anthostomella pinea]|uniref:Crossover junction endonuclease MUS81 n=1 Tax=Anthostomella pinea TaxID=933095 RepID=A0AAI8V6R9_9PEZI|nr:Uu.00g048810.m01.CDS01 [Anthostomella pinea]